MTYRFGLVTSPSAYCVWSVIQSQSSISISLVSFLPVEKSGGIDKIGAKVEYNIVLIVRGRTKSLSIPLNLIGLFCTRRGKGSVAPGDSERV